MLHRAEDDCRARAAATATVRSRLDYMAAVFPSRLQGSIALWDLRQRRPAYAMPWMNCSAPIVDRRLLVRRLNVVAADLLDGRSILRSGGRSDMSEYMQPDLFDALNSSSDSSIAGCGWR